MRNTGKKRRTSVAEARKPPVVNWDQETIKRLYGAEMRRNMKALECRLKTSDRRHARQDSVTIRLPRQYRAMAMERYFLNAVMDATTASGRFAQNVFFVRAMIKGKGSKERAFMEIKFVPIPRGKR